MKRFITILLSLALFLACLSGCGGVEATPSPMAASTPPIAAPVVNNDSAASHPSLVGKWAYSGQTSSRDTTSNYPLGLMKYGDTVEFKETGTMVIVQGGGDPLLSHWRWFGQDSVEVDYSPAIYASPKFIYTITMSDDGSRMNLTSEGGALLAFDRGSVAKGANGQLRLSVSISITGVENPPAQNQEATFQDELRPSAQQKSGEWGDSDSNVPTFKVHAFASSTEVTPGQKIRVWGSGLRPNTSGEVLWQNAGTNATLQSIGTFTTDEAGAFSLQTSVPSDPDFVINSFGFPNNLILVQVWCADSLGCSR
ncbi:MAG TPA: hypothetical protein VF826_06960 [Chloroflexia bacterium]